MQCQPPEWAQWLLRSMLEPRHRETIPGDLLEDYRERLNHESRSSVNAWYIRQVLSFVNAAGLRRLLLPGSSAWVAAVAVFQFAILVAAPVWAGVTPGWALFAFSTIALAAAGICALASAPERRVVMRASGLWILPFLATSLVVLTASTYSPIAGVLIFFFCVPGASFHAAARSGKLSPGIAAGIAAGSAIVLVATASTMMLHHPHPPLTTLPFVLGIVAILSAIGGLFGSRFSRFASIEPELLSIVS
jgi:hypothetical protein